MILQSYKIEMFRPKCNPNSQSVHCVAHLEEDIAEALPYLNTALHGADYVRNPPALTLKLHGKRIILHPQEIFINAIENEEEAEKLFAQLKDEINRIWAKRADIEPNFDTPPAPQWLEVLKLLPKTNCRKCDEPTCTVFSMKAVQGVKTIGHCPDVSEENKQKLVAYLGRFDLNPE